MMPKRRIQDRFTTKLREETFLHIIDNSKMGITIIQRGYLLYFNQKFTEIFGYTKEDILKWKNREYYKIIHPDDLSQLTKNFKVADDKKTISVKFRGITKDKEIIDIETYICPIYYKNTIAYVSTHFPLDETYKEEYASPPIKVSEKKKIMVDFHPKIIRLLEDNNVEFDLYNIQSFREEV
jgi:PAS domain S-box-containing protein